MNVVINMIMGTMIAGLAEGMALAEKCGVNQHDVLEILEMGSMNCSLIRQKGKCKYEAMVTTSTVHTAKLAIIFSHSTGL